MRKYSREIIAFVLLFTIVVAQNSIATPDKPLIWVAVRLFAGDNNVRYTEYMGAMEKQQFDAITSNSQTNGFFKLSYVSWVDEKLGVVFLSESENGRKSYGYSNEVYFLVGGITRMTLLTEDMQKKILEKLEQDSGGDSITAPPEE